MKKVFVGVIISLLATFAAQAADLTILTKVEGSDHKWIKPCITIKNSSLTNTIQLQGKIVKYYFYAYNLDYTALQFATWSCPVNGVTIRVVPYTPEYTAGAKKANFVFEMKFTQSTIMNKNSTLGEFKYGFHMPDWRVFYEDDDWSYSPTTNYTQNNNVPIFDGTTLYWGNPPPVATPVLTSITVSPLTATVNTGTPQQFTAIGKDQFNAALVPQPTITWSVSGSGASVTPTTGSTSSFSSTAAGTFIVTATSGTVSGIATVTVTAVGPVLTRIEIAPPSATVNVFDFLSFNATGYDQNNNIIYPVPNLVWSVSSNKGGTKIEQNGFFTAGAVRGNFTVTATSGTVSQTAIVTVKNDNFDLAKTKIQHVIIIMQENRSFDQYFGIYGTVRGKDVNGYPADLSPVPQKFSDTRDPDFGHTANEARICINNGGTGPYLQPKGFLMVAGQQNDAHPTVMNYHDESQIPNYWAYADHFVLQDNLFQPCRSFSLPSHLCMISGWSAALNSSSGKWEASLDPAQPKKDGRNPNDVTYGWNDITDMLFHHTNPLDGTPDPVSWGYYKSIYWDRSCNCQPSCYNVTKGKELDSCQYWQPLMHFPSVRDKNGQLGNIMDVQQFFAALANDQVPKVTWIADPGQEISEHPTPGGQGGAGCYDIKDGQAYVTTIINEIMSHPNTWGTCAIFLSWDDWGGYYDHVRPPQIDQPMSDGNYFAYGLRVPALVISPYAKPGYVDHQQLSHDAYLKFIEDVFLNDGTVISGDDRPYKPEDKLEGDLLNDFDFSQTQPTLIKACSY